MPTNLSDSNDNINRILGVDIQYEVPLYQRRYVWNKANWETLLENIFDLAKLKPLARGEGHFTGPIVTRSIAGAQNKFEVIDGQQRLTTFEIIFCVIRDLCIGLEDLRDNAIITDAERHLLSGSNHKLIPTIYDRKAFKKIVKRRYGTKIHKAFDINKNLLDDNGVKRLKEDAVEKVRLQVFGKKKVSTSILNAYRYFYEEIRHHVQKDSNEVFNLISVIKNDFKIIHLSLGETEQAEKVFESINATGRMLKNFDYLRNNLFLRARNLGEDPIEKVLFRDKYYENSDYWRFENESNYWDTDKLESFLRTFLMATWNPRCFEEKNAQPFGEYQKYSKKLERTHAADKQRIPYEFQQLSGWAKSYRELLEDEPKFDAYVKLCKDVDLSRDLDSLILFVKHNHPNQLDKVIEILESYTVRRMFVLEKTAYTLAEITKESYDNIVGFLFEVVTKKDVTFSTEAFAKFLQKHEWPDEDKVIKAFEQADSKNFNFITYMFHEIVKWDKERSSLYGQEPLSWGEHGDLSRKIEELLKDDSDKLMEIFNEIWPPPFYFTNNFES